MNEPTLKVLIFGAGGVGAYFGGRLAQAGAEVAVVCRSDYASVQKNGFRIRSIAGDFEFMPARTCRSAAEYQDVADVALVATKVLPGVNVPELIRPAVASDTSIFIVQNGIDVENEFAVAFPGNEILSAIAYIGVFREGGGRITHQGAGWLRAGVYQSGNASPRLRQLAELFRKVKVECEIVSDIIGVRWEKLVWNVPFNPISVLAGGVGTREMVTDPDLEQLCRGIMTEVCAVAGACGKRLSPEIIEKNINYTKAFPPYKTSMLLDYENNRPLEVDAILGNVIRAADKHNVPIPCIRAVYALLSSVNRNLTRKKNNG